MILGMITISNAQIEIKELKLTPEVEEILVTQIKSSLPEKSYSEYGITDSSQLENLHFDKPIPIYSLVSEKLEFVSTWSVPRMSDGDSLSLRFSNSWIVPVMSDGAPLLFRSISFFDNCGEERIMGGIYSGIKNTMEHFNNYEYKDSIIGSVRLTPSRQVMDHFIIRKDNQDIFVQIYDEVTDEYFKNEYRFSELFNHLKKLHLREKEARNRYYEKVANKSELELTPEITEMVLNDAYSFLKNKSDENLSGYGIKNRPQLEDLHPGKPIPKYRIENEKLTFTGYWEVPMMSDGEPLFFTKIKLENDEQYSLAGGYGGGMAEIIRNYEYKDLIVGFLGARRDMDFLIIRKDNKDVFVRVFDWETREYLKNEYSLSEIITARAQIGKTELKLTSEVERMVAMKIKNLPEENYSDYGIKNKSQLENLRIGKPIPRYTLEPISNLFKMPPMADWETLSLSFTKTWSVPVMSDEAPLLFGVIAFSDYEGYPFKCNIYSGTNNSIEHFHNYEHKDSIIGFVATTIYHQGVDYFMIRKENQDVFVEIYDKVTGEYFKNEYSFIELDNHFKEARMRYFDKVANKSELIITPEIIEMLDSALFSRLKSYSDEILSNCGIKDRLMLENPQIGKPTPIYTIVSENLTFTGCWEVPVMSDDDPFLVALIKLEDDEQYIYAGDGYAPLAKTIHDYIHKDLIIGRLRLIGGWGYLIIRKNNQDIFVEISDPVTYEYFKNEYSFSEVLNLLKK